MAYCVVSLHTLAIMFSNLQSGEHVTPTLTAEMTFGFAISILLNAADLENLLCFWHPFSSDVQRLIFPCSLTAASVLRLWIISCAFLSGIEAISILPL